MGFLHLICSNILSLDWFFFFQLKLIFSLEEDGRWVNLFPTSKRKRFYLNNKRNGWWKLLKRCYIEVINISLRCLPGYLELSLTWSHSYGKLLRYLFIVILFQMCAGGPDAAGAAVFCIGFFNFLTAIKLQSHVGSLWQVSLFGGGNSQLETSMFSVFTVTTEKCCHLN